MKWKQFKKGGHSRAEETRAASNWIRLRSTMERCAPVTNKIISMMYYINTHIWSATYSPVWNWSSGACKKVRRTSNSYMADSTVGFKIDHGEKPRKPRISSQITYTIATYWTPMIIKTASVTPNCLQDGCSIYLKLNGDRLGIGWSSNFSCSHLDAVTLGSDGADSQLSLARTRRRRRTWEVVTTYIAWGRWADWPTSPRIWNMEISTRWLANPHGGHSHFPHNFPSWYVKYLI